MGKAKDLQVSFGGRMWPLETTTLVHRCELIPDLKPLAGLRILKDLNLTRLGGLKNIKILHLENMCVTDLGALASLTHLRKLKVATSPVSNLTPLSSLRKLSGTLVMNLEPLRGLQNLEVLNFSNTLVTDLAPLERIQSLRHVRLGGTGVPEWQIRKLRAIVAAKVSGSSVTL